MKTLLKVTAATAVVAATVVAVRRFDLLNKGAALVETAVDKAGAGAEWLTAKAVEVTDQLLTKYDNATADTTVDPDADAYRRGPGGNTGPMHGDVR